MKRNMKIIIVLALLLISSVTSTAFGQTQGEILPNTFLSYPSNDFGIKGPEKFMVWDAPLFYAEDSQLVKYWEVYVEGHDLGSNTIRFFTNPFSLYWDRAFYRLNESGIKERVLAPIGRYKARISAFGHDESLRSQRDVEIVIPSPDKAWYENYPDVYWPQTGSDLRFYLLVRIGSIVILGVFVFIVKKVKRKSNDKQKQD